MQFEGIVALLTVLGVFIANAALILPLFLRVRAEARADMRHTDAKLESTRELVAAIYHESKEFHNRLALLKKSARAHNHAASCCAKNSTFTA
jgi:hypothetical protein